MAEVKYIIGIACLAILISETSGIIKLLKHYWYHKIFLNSKREIIKIPSWKPFDCPKCLAFWIALLFYSITENTITDIILYSSICHITALLLSNVIRKSI